MLNSLLMYMKAPVDAPQAKIKEMKEIEPKKKTKHEQPLEHTVKKLNKSCKHVRARPMMVQMKINFDNGVTILI